MRDVFCLDPKLTFLNHGSFGACPREVIEAQQRWTWEMERNPVEFLGRRSGELLAHARERLGKHLHARADDLVFVSNATTAVSIVAQSLPLEPGDEVLSTDLEYGACDAAWQHICEAKGAVYRKVHIALPFDRDAFAPQVMAHVTPRTKLIFASHITSGTALILPAQALCQAARERGILTLIDGAHAPGQIDLDLGQVAADFYTGNCHKWLCAPKGSAFLHVRREHQNTLQSPVMSWGYSAAAQGHPAYEAYLGKSTFHQRLQWLGTRDISAWLSVPTAIAFQARYDWPPVRARCHALALHAHDTLTQRWGTQAIAPPDSFAQMVAIPLPPQTPKDLQQRLFTENRIEVPITHHAGQNFLRVSVQGYNTEADIEKLMDADALR